MKLSIIIPAYNAADYIKSCLLSLYAQNIPLEDFEVLVINDGSTDNTKALVESFQENHSNLQLVNQENSGNGAARNAGIKLTKGTYIYFLDADDYIAKNSLGKLISKMEKHQLDILGFSSKIVNDDNHKTSTTEGRSLELKTIYNGIDFIANHNYDAEIWWYMIKKSFFISCNISFYDRKFVQDSYFTPSLFSKAKRISYLPLDVHRYRKSDNSITRNKSEEHLKKHFKDLSFAIDKISELRERLVKDGVTNKEALTRIRVKQQRYVFLVILRFLKSSLPKEELKSMLTHYKELGAYPMKDFSKSSDYKSPTFRLIAFVFNRSSLLYPALRIYRFFK